MSDKPILFSGEMVRAILEGRKTQTRRVIKPQPYAIIKDWPYVDDPHEVVDEQTGRIKKVFSDENMNRFVRPLKCPYGMIGDRLWVRETCLIHLEPNKYKSFPEGEVVYRADFQDGATAEPGWTPSIFMPRWASRITLEVTGVRVERVQDISEGDAIAEGAGTMEREFSRGWYSVLWDSINAKRGYPWNSNPWVWVIEFRKIK